MNRSSMLKANPNSSDSSVSNDYISTPTDSYQADSRSKVEFPDFAAYGGKATYAITARLAGRINAASVSASELKELLNEREKLINKAVNGEITRRESNRLEYVRWSLDRIEDAKYGYTLDSLESMVEYYEKFESDIQELKSQLEGLRKRK